MAGIFILILLSFALFYFLTRTIWVRIIKDENFKIEIHLPLLSLHFTNESRKKSNKKTCRKINFIDYYRIITDIVEKTKNSEKDILSFSRTSCTLLFHLALQVVIVAITLVKRGCQLQTNEVTQYMHVVTSQIWILTFTFSIQQFIK